MLHAITPYHWVVVSPHWFYMRMLGRCAQPHNQPYSFSATAFYPNPPAPHKFCGPRKATNGDGRVSPTIAPPLPPPLPGPLEEADDHPLLVQRTASPPGLPQCWQQGDPTTTLTLLCFRQAVYDFAALGVPIAAGPSRAATPWLT